MPLLLRLGEEQVALKKAVESGNTDLVYTVILHLREHMPLSDFQVSTLKIIYYNIYSVIKIIYFSLDGYYALSISNGTIY